MTIHNTDPFGTPDAQRSPVRRLRGRLPAAVTLWTAGESTHRAGLTVSSTLVVDGDPGRLLGVLDPESQLCETLQHTGRAVVAPLRDEHQLLADRFAGLLPVPGGPFRIGEWRDTGYGPIAAGLETWVTARLDSAREVGWGLLVELIIDEVAISPDTGDSPLIYYRGRYHSRLG